MKWIAAAVVASSFSIAWAQDKLVESVEVRVVNVDVVVTDRSGHPVRGLKKDDFEVYENGRKRLITNLYEVGPPAAAPSADDAPMTTATTEGTAAAESAPAVSRRRRILVFVDNFSLTTARRSEVLQSVDRFIDQLKQPDDEVALVVWNHSAKIVTPFTTDANQMKKGTAALRTQVRSGLSFPQEGERVRAECQRYYDQAESGFMSFQEAYGLSRASVNAFAEESLMASKSLLAGLRTTIAQFAGLDGKKVLVFAGAHMPEAPGEDLYFWLVRTYRRQPQLRNLSLLSVDPPRTSAHFALDDAARQATMNDVALYFIDGGEKGDDSHSAEQRGTIETSALETYLAANNTADAFRHLADLTGGTVVSRWSSFDIAFDTVARDLNSYYSLGFRPEGNENDKSDKRITVKLKDRAYTARARLSYTPKTLDAEINERVIANLFHGEVKGDWSISVKTGTPQRDGKYFKVPMEISIAPTVTLVPNGNEVAGGYTVYVVMGNSEGAMSKVMKTSQDVHLPAAAEKDLRTRPLVFAGVLMVRGGENMLSVGVVDRISNVAGYARTKVMAQ